MNATSSTIATAARSPGSPTARLLRDAASRSASPRGRQGFPYSRAAQDALRAVDSFPTSPLAQTFREVATASSRVASRAVEAQEAWSRKMALITASPRVRDIFDPTIRAGGAFSFVRNHDRAPHSAIARDLQRYERMERSRVRRLVEDFDRYATIATPAGMPSVTSTPVARPRVARANAIPPRDEIIHEVQERCRALLSVVCPEVLTRLDAARQALGRAEDESAAHGMVSCRRALEALADHVVSPQAYPLIDLEGNKRKAGEDKWANRLLHFCGTAIASETGRELAISHVGLLAGKLDALRGKLGVGVHKELTLHEAQGMYLMTWVLVEQVVSHVDL